MPKNTLIQLQQVTKTYFRSDGEILVAALRGVDLTIERGEYLAIMGPSGSGKSTLMNLLGCLDQPTEGQYELDGEMISSLDDQALSRIRGQKIGFIFQAFNLISDMSVAENVELPLTYRSDLSSEARKTLVADALEKVDMQHRANHFPSQLSGGQQQRVAVARAISGKPSLILADEPTGNLDSKNAQSVMALLDQLHQRPLQQQQHHIVLTS